MRRIVGKTDGDGDGDGKIEKGNLYSGPLDSIS